MSDENVDITVTQKGGLMVADIQSESEAGCEFVDAWVTVEMVVVDSGHIMLYADDAGSFVAAAKSSGLVIAEERQ